MPNFLWWKHQAEDRHQIKWLKKCATSWKLFVNFLAVWQRIKAIVIGQIHILLMLLQTDTLPNCYNPFRCGNHRASLKEVMTYRTRAERLAKITEQRPITKGLWYERHVMHFGWKGSPPSRAEVCQLEPTQIICDGVISHTNALVILLVFQRLGIWSKNRNRLAEFIQFTRESSHCPL